MRKDQIKKPRLAPEHPVVQLLEAGDSQRVALGQILCIDCSVMQQRWPATGIRESPGHSKKNKENENIPSDL